MTSRTIKLSRRIVIEGKLSPQKSQLFSRRTLIKRSKSSNVTTKPVLKPENMRSKRKSAKMSTASRAREFFVNF